MIKKTKDRHKLIEYAIVYIIGKSLPSPPNILELSSITSSREYIIPPMTIKMNFLSTFPKVIILQFLHFWHFKAIYLIKY